jgi:hypothetical protein
MPSGAKPKQYPPLLVGKVRALYAGGATQHEIAGQLGLTQKIVWRLMRRHGIQARIAAKRDQRGSKNHMWRGGGASYAALHYRMSSLRGQPKCCQKCGTTEPTRTYDWANLTGQYDNPSDYQRMCRSCHWKYDQKVLNIHHMREREVLDV